MPRIALISDIHGNLAALEAVAADIQKRAVDCVVNLGDSLSGPLLPLETAQLLMAAGWLSLAGNHEQQLLTLRAGHGGTG
jgi:predicted phosphodiesterase